MDLLDQRLRAMLAGKLDAAQTCTLKQLEETLLAVREAAQRMSEICLFLDQNYYQKLQKEPLIKRLEANIFRTLTSDLRVLQALAQVAFNARSQPNP
jgi:hypothetical protein